MEHVSSCVGVVMGREDAPTEEIDLRARYEACVERIVDVLREHCGKGFWVRRYAHCSDEDRIYLGDTGLGISHYLDLTRGHVVLRGDYRLPVKVHELLTYAYSAAFERVACGLPMGRSSYEVDMRWGRDND